MPACICSDLNNGCNYIVDLPQQDGGSLSPQRYFPRHTRRSYETQHNIVIPPSANVDMTAFLPSSGSRKLWPDQMPEETRKRIATYVTRRQRTESALSLAETSELQRQTLLTTLPHEVILSYRKSFPFPPRWDAVLTGHIRNINVDWPPYEIPMVLPFPLELFEAPTLRSAAVHYNPIVLHAFSKSTSLRELSVSIQMGGWQQRLMECISRLNLTSLN